MKTQTKCTCSVSAIPHCFTKVTIINKAKSKDEPSTTKEYLERGMQAPKKLTYAVNDEAIAIVDPEGEVSVAHKSDAPYHCKELKTAIKILKLKKYTLANFYIPFTTNNNQQITMA